MGSLKMKRVLIVTVILFLVIISRLTFLRPTDMIYKIYQNQHGFNFYILAGIIPKEFRDSYKKTIIEIGENYELYTLNNMNSPIPEVYIILCINDQDIMLKGYPLSLLSNQEIPTKFDKVDAQLIDLEVFNEYIHIADIHANKEIVQKFIEFLTDGQDFKIIEGQRDIDGLIKKYESNRIGNPLFIEDEFAPDELISSPDIITVWFLGKGIVRFVFTFSGQRVEKVESIRLGLLGFENPYCC